MALTNPQYTDDYINAHKTKLKTKLVGVFETTPARQLTAEMKVMRGSVVVATGAIGDHIVFGKLPKNVTILGCYWRGSLGTMQIGVADLEENITDGQALAGALTAANVASWVNFYLASDTLLVGQVDGALTVGAPVELVVMYTEM